ncbi:hypothetical protein PIROE2DRAFT_17097, partial [Piromyces sp. E2]
NTLGKFGPLFLKAVDLVISGNQDIIDDELHMVYTILGIFIIPTCNKSIETIKNGLNVFKYIPTENMDEIIKKFEDQINEHHDTHLADNTFVADDSHKKKRYTCSTMKIKAKFILYSIFKDEVMNTIIYLGNSAKRVYYASSVGLRGFETIIQDVTAFDLKTTAHFIEMADKLQDTENKLKSGYYGAPLSSFKFLSEFLGKPGCVRPERFKYQCDKRVFDEEYTEELASSSLNYIMTEYINKLNEFKKNLQVETEVVVSPDGIGDTLEKMLNTPFIKFHNKVIDDIAGHTFRYVEKSRVFLMNKVIKILKMTFVVHIIAIIIIVFLFLIYITKQIKHQLHIMDELISVILTVPLSVYNSSSKLKR